MSDHDFEDALRRGFDELRASRGPCPSRQTLEDYRAGSLSDAEARALVNHIECCGQCDMHLVRMRSFDRGATNVTPIEPEREQRLHRKAIQLRIKRTIATYGGYTIAAVLLVCAYAGILPFNRTQSHQARFEAIQAIPLDSVRDGPERTIPKPDSRFVVLSFLIDAQPGLAYLTTLDGGPSSPISPDSFGRFNVLLESSLIAPGSHQLVVQEMDPQLNATIRTLPFPFVVR